MIHVDDCLFRIIPENRIIVRIIFFAQVVDMRWGVRDEMTNEHMTTALCMTEVCGYKMSYYLI